MPPRPPAKAKGRLPAINHKLAAIGAAGVFALVAFGAIQTFGDPTAAGPRRIVELNPAAAFADAQRVPFHEAAEEGSELQQFGLNELPPYPGSEGQPAGGYEIGTDGQLRVAVVETESGAARVTPARPLPRAPFAGLTEQGPNGPLPVVGAQGRTPAAAYARPASLQQGRPSIAIIVGGLGFNARATTQAIDELPAEVTLSFVPYAQDLQSWIDRARARGHEVMLELPMEPFDPEADDTGPQTLLASATAQQNTQRLENLLSRGAGYFGVTNYQGARFATSAQASAPVVQQLKRRGLVFLASGIGQRTALTVEAQRAGLTNTTADRIIDARREADAIDEQLLNLEALALQNQSAIGAGFAYPVTMEQVARWARDVGSRGYQLAPVSAVLSARAARR
jgi:polysaccharide deacetylase 2 family uncharacterized protein YibQ